MQVCRLGSIKHASCLFSQRASGNDCQATHCVQSNKICGNLVGCIPHCHRCILSHLQPTEDSSVGVASSGAPSGLQDVVTV